jgi:hypothetical protein
MVCAARIPCRAARALFCAGLITRAAAAGPVGRLLALGLILRLSRPWA